MYNAWLKKYQIDVDRQVRELTRIQKPKKYLNFWEWHSTPHVKKETILSQVVFFGYKSASNRENIRVWGLSDKFPRLDPKKPILAVL